MLLTVNLSTILLCSRTTFCCTKHHYKDIHRAKCTEPTPLALITFEVLLNIKQDFQRLLKVQCVTALHANHSQDYSMDARWLKTSKLL